MPTIQSFSDAGKSTTGGTDLQLFPNLRFPNLRFPATARIRDIKIKLTNLTKEGSYINICVKFAIFSSLFPFKLVEIAKARASSTKLQPSFGKRKRDENAPYDHTPKRILRENTPKQTTKPQAKTIKTRL